MVNQDNFQYIHPVKKASIVVALMIACMHLQAQSRVIKEVFLRLPVNEVYGMTKATRDSLLQGKTFYPAGNDSNEIIAITYGVSTQVQNYLYVSLSFETGQRATGMIELRSFRRSNGEQIILVSRTGGVSGINYQQQNLSAFLYTAKKQLLPYRKKVLPAPEIKLLLKSGAPSSAKKTIANNSNICYSLNEENVVMTLNSHYLTSNASTKKWLKGDSIYFKWASDRFVLSSIGFLGE